MKLLKTINARDLWWQIINARAETGEPYMINIDRCNEALPKQQKDLGLKYVKVIYVQRLLYQLMKKEQQSVVYLLLI
jgi:ribonucleotide reductase alpha subunit